MALIELLITSFIVLVLGGIGIYFVVRYLRRHPSKSRIAQYHYRIRQLLEYTTAVSDTSEISESLTALALAGVSLDEPLDKRQTLLGDASSNPDPTGAALLLAAGADPNLPCEPGIHNFSLRATPLLNAIHAKATRTVEHLLKHGADPTIESQPYVYLEGETEYRDIPFEVACQIGNLENVALLLDAEPTLIATSGNLLKKLLASPRIELATLLLDRWSASQSESLDPELIFSCRNSEMVQLLLDRGVYDLGSDTLLAVRAAERGASDLILALSELDVDLTQADQRGRTPLMAFVRHIVWGPVNLLTDRSIQALELLCQQKSQAIAKDADGKSALIHAVCPPANESRFGRIGDFHGTQDSVIQTLLLQGINPLIRDDQGNTVEDYARQQGQDDLSQKIQAVALTWEIISIGTERNDPQLGFFWHKEGDGVGPNQSWDERIRDIGLTLFSNGGQSISMMLAAHESVVAGLGTRAGQDLSAHWHNIGLDRDGHAIATDVWRH